MSRMYPAMGARAHAPQTLDGQAILIPLAEPNLTGKEAEYTAQAIASGWVGPDGPFIERFEEMVAKAAGRKWAVATITGSAALHAAAAALGFEGRSVGVPNDIFPAARNVFRLLGCVITDLRPRVNHDVQTYGYAGWPTLCDRAPAIGEPPTEITLECYSFAANKTVTCGQGGAVVGDDSQLETEVLTFIRQGHGLAGATNTRMANLNAAMGCAQMERLEEFRGAKWGIWDYYARFIGMQDRGASRWMATMEWGDASDRFVAYLKECEIEARTEPNGGVNLPCSTSLTMEQQDKVIKACAAFSQ